MINKKKTDKKYQKPALTDYGDLTEITKANGSHGDDGLTGES